MIILKHDKCSTARISAVSQQPQETVALGPEPELITTTVNQPTHISLEGAIISPFPITWSLEQAVHGNIFESFGNLITNGVPFNVGDVIPSELIYVSAQESTEAIVVNGLDIYNRAMTTLVPVTTNNAVKPPVPELFGVSVRGTKSRTMKINVLQSTGVVSAKVVKLPDHPSMALFLPSSLGGSAVQEDTTIFVPINLLLETSSITEDVLFASLDLEFTDESNLSTPASYPIRVYDSKGSETSASPISSEDVHVAFGVAHCMNLPFVYYYGDYADIYANLIDSLPEGVFGFDGSLAGEPVTPGVKMYNDFCILVTLSAGSDPVTVNYTLFNKKDESSGEIGSLTFIPDLPSDKTRPIAHAVHQFADMSLTFDLGFDVVSESVEFQVTSFDFEQANLTFPNGDSVSLNTPFTVPTLTISSVDIVLANFSFMVTNLDNGLTSEPATVFTQIGPKNNPPSAALSSEEVVWSYPKTIMLNASDPDLDGVYCLVTSVPKIGALFTTFDLVNPVARIQNKATLPSCAVIYHPVQGEEYMVKFDWKCEDGRGASSASNKIFIEVIPPNPLPIFEPTSVSITEDSVLPLVLKPSSGIFETGKLVRNGSFTGLYHCEKGIIVEEIQVEQQFSSSESVCVNPAPNQSGEDYLILSAIASNISADPWFMMINVSSVIDLPIVYNQSLWTWQATPIPVFLSFTSEAPANVSILSASDELMILLHDATVSVPFDIEYPYLFDILPTREFSGNGTLIVNVTSEAGSVLSEVVIEVRPVNRQPEVKLGTVYLKEDETAFFFTNATDPDGDMLTIVITEPPIIGEVFATGTEIALAKGSRFEQGTELQYIPPVNAFDLADGDGILSFIATDGLLRSKQANMTFIVESVNDPPIANSTSITGIEDTALLFNLEGNDIDNESEVLLFKLLTLPTKGRLCKGFENLCNTDVELNMTITSSLVYIPNDNVFGDKIDSFEFVAIDPFGMESEIAVVTVNLKAVKNPPIAPDLTFNITEDKKADIQLFVSDPDQDLFTYTVATLPKHGALFQGE